jgi:hypothetical protein
LRKEYFGSTLNPCGTLTHPVDFALPAAAQKRKDFILAGDDPARWEIEAIKILTHSFGHLNTYLSTIFPGTEKSICYARRGLTKG